MGRRTEENLAWTLNHIARVVLRQFSARLQPFGLTPPQWGVLVALWGRDGQSLTELAHASSFDGPTMTGIVDRLEQAGLVERRRHPSDRRVVNVHLTNAGRALHEHLPQVAEETNRAITRGLTDGELAEFTRMLTVIAANLSERPFGTEAERGAAPS